MRIERPCIDLRLVHGEQKTWGRGRMKIKWLEVKLGRSLVLYSCFPEASALMIQAPYLIL